MTHYCALLLPQRPEFTDFEALVRLDNSSFRHKRGDGQSSGFESAQGNFNSKRQISDVNSFDCEDSDGDDELSVGNKTPKVADDCNFSSSLHMIEDFFSPPLFTVSSSGRLNSSEGEAGGGGGGGVDEFCLAPPNCEETRNLRCENQSTCIDSARQFPTNANC